MIKPGSRIRFTANAPHILQGVTGEVEGKFLVEGTGAQYEDNWIVILDNPLSGFYSGKAWGSVDEMEETE